MCGVFGIVGNEPVASTARVGLYDLQHRGEQGFGIATSDGRKLYLFRSPGLVTEVFQGDESSEDALAKKLPGDIGIGHCLYSTVGKNDGGEQPLTLQPLTGDFHGEQFALGHNGNLINLAGLRREAEGQGFKFQFPDSDTEVLVALLSVSKKTDFIEALLEVLPRLQGSFSLVILLKDKVIGVRDQNGIRPLCLGRISTTHYVIASENCALHTLGGSFIREIRPGELIILSRNGVEKSMIWAKSPSLKLCLMEFIYFARPDSTLGGRSVHSYRDGAGQAVALEHPIKGADLISSVPESGSLYNYGVAQVLGVPVKRAISRNRYYARRTFLMPRKTNRKSLQGSKFFVLRDLVSGKIIIITEDSVIRGNVAPEVVAMLRRMGACEVHLLVGSSPIRWPCFLGIDIPTQNELIAANCSVKEVERKISVDSLGYLSIKGMIESTGLPETSLCLGCFSGCYPVAPPPELTLIEPPAL